MRLQVLREFECRSPKPKFHPSSGPLSSPLIRFAIDAVCRRTLTLVIPPPPPFAVFVWLLGVGDCECPFWVSQERQILGYNRTTYDSVTPIQGFFGIDMFSGT